jgi:hypothetical protein
MLSIVKIQNDGLIQDGGDFIFHLKISKMKILQKKLFAVVF